MTQIIPSELTKYSEEILKENYDLFIFIFAVYTISFWICII